MASVEVDASLLVMSLSIVPFAIILWFFSGAGMRELYHETYEGADKDGDTASSVYTLGLGGLVSLIPLLVAV